MARPDIAAVVELRPGIVVAELDIAAVVEAAWCAVAAAVASLVVAEPEPVGLAGHSCGWQYPDNAPFLVDWAGIFGYLLWFLNPKPIEYPVG